MQCSRYNKLLHSHERCIPLANYVYTMYIISHRVRILSAR